MKKNIRELSTRAILECLFLVHFIYYQILSMLIVDIHGSPSNKHNRKPSLFLFHLSFSVGRAMLAPSVIFLSHPMLIPIPSVFVVSTKRERYSTERNSLSLRHSNDIPISSLFFSRPSRTSRHLTKSPGEKIRK